MLNQWRFNQTSFGKTRSNLIFSQLLCAEKKLNCCYGSVKVQQPNNTPDYPSQGWNIKIWLYIQIHQKWNIIVNHRMITPNYITRMVIADILPSLCALLTWLHSARQKWRCIHDTTFISHIKDMRLLLNVCYL